MAVPLALGVGALAGGQYGVGFLMIGLAALAALTFYLWCGAHMLFAPTAVLRHHVMMTLKLASPEALLYVMFCIPGLVLHAVLMLHERFVM